VFQDRLVSAALRESLGRLDRRAFPVLLENAARQESEARLAFKGHAVNKALPVQSAQLGPAEKQV
jgi:hypothetical protein